MLTPQIVLTYLKLLKIADAKTIGAILFSLGYCSTLHSARVQAQKHLNKLVSHGQAVRGVGFYRIPECSSQYGEHARLLTLALAEILKVKSITPTIYREKDIPIGYRADALVFCQRETKGICFVLETAHTETHIYLKRKVDAWRNWKEARSFLSETFGTTIKSYGFAVSGREVSGAVPFSKILTMLGGENA